MPAACAQWMTPVIYVPVGDIASKAGSVNVDQRNDRMTCQMLLSSQNIKLL